MTLATGRATVKDVAALAGVSPKTVSNVVTGSAAVSASRRARVEAAMDELGYVPNLSARGLRNGRSGVIAVALPTLDTEFSALMMKLFVELAHERGLAVQIEETGLAPERERDLISKARAHLVDGLVLNPIADHEIGYTERLPPVVLIGEAVETGMDQVVVDNVAASALATAHLLERGARRILVVGAPGEEFRPASAERRLEGLHAVLSDAGIPADPALEPPAGDWTIEVGSAVVERFLAEHPAPDAVFAFTDSMALGAMAALWRAGLRVPDDVLVCGFDDVPSGRLAMPPLTTLSWDRAAVAAAALELLVHRFDDRVSPARMVTIPHRLEIRASTTRA